jgi:hypothetical protein
LLVKLIEMDVESYTKLTLFFENPLKIFKPMIAKRECIGFFR